jgi:hypothetical protein
MMPEGLAVLKVCYLDALCGSVEALEAAKSKTKT